MARLEPGKEFAVSQVRAEAAWNPGGIGSEDKSRGQTQNYLGRRSSSWASGPTAVGVRERAESTGRCQCSLRCGAAWGGAGRREQMGQNSVCEGEGPETHAHDHVQEAVSLSGSAVQERRSEWTYSSGQLHLKNATWNV